MDSGEEIGTKTKSEPYRKNVDVVVVDTVYKSGGIVSNAHRSGNTV